MGNKIDPKVYGLPSRTELRLIDNGRIAIVKKRKSRIIMKDGFKIEEQARQIKSTSPDIEISIIVSGPVCSKTLAFLEENQIEVIQAESKY